MSQWTPPTQWTPGTAQALAELLEHMLDQIYRRWSGHFDEQARRQCIEPPKSFEHAPIEPTMSEWHTDPNHDAS